MLVNRPRKFVVQLPRNARHHYREEGNDTWHCKQVWSDIFPHLLPWVNVSQLRQTTNSVIDLIILDCSVDKHTQIVAAESDNLNCVLESQGIVHQYQLVQETEDEEGEVCWDGLDERYRGHIMFQTQLEFCEDISWLN